MRKQSIVSTKTRLMHMVGIDVSVPCDPNRLSVELRLYFDRDQHMVQLFKELLRSESGHQYTQEGIVNRLVRLAFPRGTEVILSEEGDASWG